TAGESGQSAPAGEMWSVVTESPSITRQRAPAMSSTVPGSREMPSKYGGRRTYVDDGSQAKSSSGGVSSACQRSSPVKTSPYVLRYIAPSTDEAIVASTSAGEGQMSCRYTGPSSPSPS